MTNKPDNINKKYFCRKWCGRCTYFHGCVWLAGAKKLEKLQESFFYSTDVVLFQKWSHWEYNCDEWARKNCTSGDFIHSRVTFFSIRCSYKETEHLWNTRIQSKNPYILNSMQLRSNVFWWYPQTVDGFFSGDRQLACQQQTVFKTCISVFITFFSAFHTESCFVYFFMLLTYKL